MRQGDKMRGGREGCRGAAGWPGDCSPDGGGGGGWGRLLEAAFPRNVMGSVRVRRPIASTRWGLSSPPSFLSTFHLYIR